MCSTATRGSRRNTLEWRSEDDVAFIQKMEQPMSTTLVAPRPGLYYIYCQVGFVGTDTHLLLLSQVLTWDEATNQNVSLILGTESVSAPPWRASLTLGGLVHLQGEQRLYVHVSHPQFVDYSEGKTFFGVIKIS
ncbi:hypothetical protein GDO81_029333 [Engystomops pustulosus]|uniref:THD domain-containing protein n=1 Tax=Engystomops pustulosus TaxID=76066 RepID=A0AAV6YIQ8_ENGPU|nr:hypothetical protein GDO81_029333 [Engystomops pustulosus]